MTRRGHYLFIRTENGYFLKAVGQIKYPVSSDLSLFLNKIFENQDFDYFLIDLTETQVLDSTNLGLLAKIARLMLESRNHKTMLISTSEDINELLQSIGYDQVFILVTNPEQLKPPVQISLKGNEVEQFARMAEIYYKVQKMIGGNEAEFVDVVDCLKLQ
jgi:anti-anti-sigma factor